MGRRKKVTFEEWKAIEGFNGDFEISRSGKVRMNNVKETIKTGTSILVKNIGSVLIPRCNLSKGVYTCKYRGKTTSVDIKSAYADLFPTEINPFVRKARIKKALIDYIKKDKEITKTVLKSIIPSNPFSEALQTILDGWDELSIPEIKEQLVWVAESAYIEPFNISELKETIAAKFDSLNTEVWMPVEGTNERYFVSNTGKMKSVYKGKEKLVGAQCGWTKTPYVTYYINGEKINIQVAKVILKTFTGVEGKKVRFKDNDQTNLRLDNLEWKK